MKIINNENNENNKHLNTTTTGLSLPVTTTKPFHIINAENTINARFIT